MVLALTRPAKLLLVDDKPENLLALEAVLDGSDYVLFKAHSGAEALALTARHPDLALILLDVQMPNMDGFEVARRIKALPQGREIPIIFITAIHTEDPFVKKGFQAGGIDYFTKPFDPEILKLKVGVYTAFRQKAELLRERERQLKESEELLRATHKLSAVLETLPVGVIVADAAGRICQTNGEVLKIWGSDEQSQHDAYGEFMEWWLRDGGMFRESEGPLMNALTTGRASHNEVITIKCFDGSLKSILTSASPLRGFDSSIVGAVVVMQDLTEHKKVEADFERRIIHLVSLGVS
jgi:PAS domain S-box-containing protein